MQLTLTIDERASVAGGGATSGDVLDVGGKKVDRISCSFGEDSEFGALK